MPLGVYLIVHLLVNSYAMQGEAAFMEKVHLLETMPFLPVVEFTMIWAPLIYHSLFGIWVGWIAKNNPLRYGYARNWNFALQRWTGFFMLIFVFMHGLSQRFFMGPVETEAFNNVVRAIESPVGYAFFLLGIVATTYHFANGLWEFCIDWGFTVSMRSQYVMGVVSILVFLALTTVGVFALNAFRPGAVATQTSISQAQVAPAPLSAPAIQEGITHGR
jgi:succinate dehydrogenase / fumarate reductase cytochrome b subunit